MNQLADRDGLRKLPEGSVGRAYLAFVESEGISPEGIRTASAEGIAEREKASELLYVKERMRDTHDLWHTVTGYKGDVAGEIGLLSFTLAQNWHAGVALIVGAGLVKGFAVDTTRIIPDGYRRGRAAKWLPAQDWESLLPLPLEQVRASLGLGAPPVYTPVRTTQLRARGCSRSDQARLLPCARARVSSPSRAGAAGAGASAIVPYSQSNSGIVTLKFHRCMRRGS